MKCDICGREYEGGCCPYCSDSYMNYDDNKKRAPKLSVLLVFLSIIATFLSFLSPYILILAIILIALSMFVSIKGDKAFRGRLITIVSITTILMLMSVMTYLCPVFDKYFSSKKLGNTLGIELPKEKAIEYEYNSGAKNNNVSYTFYKFEIDESIYESVVNSENKKEYSENDWFIEKVSNEKSDYIVYDYMKNSFDKPTNEIDYRYLFIQVEKVDNNYYAYIYKVEKRRY